MRPSIDGIVDVVGRFLCWARPRGKKLPTCFFGKGDGLVQFGIDDGFIQLDFFPIFKQMHIMHIYTAYHVHKSKVL